MSILASALSDPAVFPALCAAPVTYFCSLAAGRWLKRRHGVPLGLMFQALCVALALYVPFRVFHAVLAAEGHRSDETMQWYGDATRHLEAILIVLAVFFLLQLMRRFFWQHWFAQTHGSEAPKLLQQVFSFAVLCVVLVLVLKMFYSLAVPTSLIAGSGIVALVIGLAVQETLANIFSGIALQISKPFRVGDWLIVENHRAEVMELNWRSTKLRTNDDIYLDIPNKAVVTHTIINLSFPTKVHANRIRLGFEYGVPPNVVRDVLVRAASNAPGVMHAPPVKVFLREFGDSAIIYEIKYSLEDERRFNDIEDAIRTNIWYEARRAGLTIPFPIRTVELRRRPAVSGHEAAPMSEIIAGQELLSPLDEDQKQRLLEHAKVRRFGRGEKVITQGSEGCSMFVIVHGEVDVVIHANDQDTTVATLRKGEAFGEMCLLTGEKRSATVRARTDCDLWELDRACLQPILRENAVVAEKLSDLLARRKMETEGILAAQAPRHAVEQKRTEYAQGFRRKIGALFEI